MFLCGGMAVALMTACAESTSTSIPRQELLLNQEYRFTLGDPQGAEKADFNDTAWAPVGIPHSFSTPYFLSPDFYVGAGWYRRTLVIPTEWTGKRIALEFEGVFQHAAIYINGKQVGGHDGGYTGFSVDITNAVHPGENLLAVRADNLWDARLAPRAGEHVFSGGIYRDVKVVATDPLHIPWCGTFVTTPKVSEAEAQVAVQVEVANFHPSQKNCLAKTEVMAPGGAIIGSSETKAQVVSGQTVVVNLPQIKVTDPQLWHPDHPHLYTAVTRIYDGSRLADTVTTTFGIRWFEFTADKGFFLNGKHLYLRGANVHQDHAGWGDAVANTGFERDLRMMKEAGFNFIRGSHYPHDPAFSGACDRLGLLFMSENCYWGIGGFGKDGNWFASTYPPAGEDQSGFEESCQRALGEMIRIHRNHPSIILWSMGNEAFFTDGKVMDKARELVKKLVARSHELDPTRPAGMGGVQRERFDKLSDVAGYNGDGARLYMNTGVPSMVAEYGSQVSDRPGEYKPFWGELQQEEFPWRSGQAVWCGFHHGSIAGSMGRMGIVDYFRLPLRTWYWYRNEYTGTPPPAWPIQGEPAAVRLTADRTKFRADGTEDTQLIVTVVDAEGRHLSDSPPVTLKVESGPLLFPTGSEIAFKRGTEIPIIEGLAAIEARAYHAGISVVRASSPGLADATLALETTDAPAFVAGKSRVWRPVAGQPTSIHKLVSLQVVNIAKGRPTSANAEGEKNLAANGNDGDENTVWQCSLASGKSAWWRVDLENFYRVNKIKITPAGAANVRVEISNDGDGDWKPIATTIIGDEKTVTIPVNSPDKGRFLRVVYTKDAGTPDSNVGHRELEVFGTMGD